MFELQSSLVVQETPTGRLPQLPLLLQTLPLSQSVLVMHVRKQALPTLLSHTYGSQGRPEVGLQAPASQRDACVSVEPAQVGARQIVPVGYRRQAPEPSQVPSLPHDARPSSAQSARGSVPTSAGTQVPTLFGAEQVQHACVHAVWQQTPSAQKPLAHSPSDAQGLPVCTVPPPSDVVDVSDVVPESVVVTGTSALASVPLLPAPPSILWIGCEVLLHESAPA
jgi:hypothetical protein